MKKIFRRDKSFQFRVLFVIVFSLFFLVIDYKFKLLNVVRNYLNAFFSPFYVIANSPRKIFYNILEDFSLKKTLLIKNELLRRELLLRKADNLLLDQLKEENSKLRKLLGSPLRKGEYITISQVITRINTPYRDQVLIDKGKNDHVYEGQPVINEKGVIGQVISVNKFNSRVLLICDASHALPVQVLRNDIRMILFGSGCVDNILYAHVPERIDVVIGDVLVTSSLGGKFPEGYPVGVISNVRHDTQDANTIISVKSTAGLQKLRYLLLLWNVNNNLKTSL